MESGVYLDIKTKQSVSMLHWSTIYYCEIELTDIVHFLFIQYRG